MPGNFYKLNIPHYTAHTTEILNEYSKSWIKSNHTHNFWYLYAFILILISWNLFYSYSEFEVLIIFILNTCMTLISTFHNSTYVHIHEAQNNYESLMNTNIYLPSGCSRRIHITGDLTFTINTTCIVFLLKSNHLVKKINPQISKEINKSN